ncbi:hypothetical protein DLREEDagrD3_15400 [Denitratisoma sp. agr-D3]
MRTTVKFPWVWLLALLVCLVQQGAVLHGLSHGLETLAGSQNGAVQSLSLLVDDGPGEPDDALCLTCVALNCFSALALAACFLCPVAQRREVLARWRWRRLSQRHSPRTRARSPPLTSAAF